jgi:hypothetical protein
LEKQKYTPWDQASHRHSQANKSSYLNSAKRAEARKGEVLEDQYIEKVVKAENTIKAIEHKAAQPTEPKPPLILTEEQVMK